jgi:hypothetical protein
MEKGSQRIAETEVYSQQGPQACTSGLGQKSAAIGMQRGSPLGLRARAEQPLHMHGSNPVGSFARDIGL